MIIILFSLNIIIFFSTYLATLMFLNNLRKINKSIDIYLDPKAYKPEHKIRFLTVLLEKYQSYKDGSLIDVDTKSLIKNYFYEQKIGTFSTQGVESMVKRGKELLWFSIITMTLYEIIQGDTMNSKLHIILIVVSAVSGLFLIFFQIYASLDTGKQKLFARIEDYLKNEYPVSLANKKAEERTSKLLSRINELENQMNQSEEKDESKVAWTIGEEDIAYFIEKLSV